MALQLRLARQALEDTKRLDQTLKSSPLLDSPKKSSVRSVQYRLSDYSTTTLRAGAESPPMVCQICDSLSHPFTVERSLVHTRSHRRQHEDNPDIRQLMQPLINPDRPPIGILLRTPFHSIADLLLTPVNMVVNDKFSQNDANRDE